MPSIPFTAYDVFAYLSSGFVIVAAADFAFPGDWVLDAELSVIEGVVWIVVAYVLGHVVAAVSAPLLERGFAETILGERQDVLFGARKKDASRLGWLFPGYFNALDEDIRRLVRARAKKEAQITSAGKALFVYCDTKMRLDANAGPMLATFLNIYGFARNACFASFVGAILLVIGAVTNHTDWQTKVWLAAAAIPVAVGLLYRYLKFYRLYARDVFLFYAASASAAE